MRILFLFLVLCCFSSWGKDPSTHASLADLMEAIRDPVFSGQERRNILDFTRKNMARKLSEELKIAPSELNLSFLKNPARVTHLLSDDWFDVQTQFYTTLHQENFQKRWIDLQKLIKFSDYGKSLHSSMMAHWGQYSPVIEGRYYVRWNTVSVKGDSRKKNFNVPYFLMSNNINELIEMEAHVPYEELFPESDRTPSRPSLQTFLRNTSALKRVARQELAEKMELNRRIYIRAVANAAKTVASVHYLSGAQNRHQTEMKVNTFMESFCDGCSQKEKKDYQKAAMLYVDHIKETISYSSTQELARNLCSSLRKNNYFWNVEKLKPTPVEILTNERKLIDYYIVHKLKEKNKIALAKTMLDEDLGILFLTNSLNILDKSNEPVGTRLRCTSSSLNLDSNHIKKAVEEAELNISTYVKRINRKLMSGRFSLPLAEETLEYFIQTNQAATAEALSSYPQGIGWTLKSIVKLDRDVRSRKKIDNIIYWGGTIVGVGLTITGVGAPEGVAILAATAGVLKGLSSGSYFLIRAQQEKRFMRELRLARAGSSGMSEANLRHHYESYKKLKVFYIKEFGQAGFAFTRLHRVALRRANGNVEKAHKVMDRVGKGAKKSAIEEGFDELQEMILEAVIS